MEIYIGFSIFISAAGIFIGLMVMLWMSGFRQSRGERIALGACLTAPLWAWLWPVAAVGAAIALVLAPLYGVTLLWNELQEWRS